MGFEKRGDRAIRVALASGDPLNEPSEVFSPLMIEAGFQEARCQPTLGGLGLHVVGER